MPQRNEPATLRKCALRTVARNFDHIGYANSNPDMIFEMVENDQYLEVEGPFTEMPSAILEDLIETLCEFRSLHRRHLHLLIHAQLETIKLSFGCGEYNFGIKFVQERCTKLRRLDLAYLHHVKPTVLHKLLRPLTTLVTLNLRMTLAAEEVLGVVGTNCPHLVELDLTATPLSDSGILALCVSSDDGSAQCQKLSRLLVSETRVSSAGVAFALHHLPSLKYLDFDDIYQVFDHLDVNSLRLGLLDNLPKFRLETLISAAEYVRNDSVEIAVAMCPYVTSVSISNCWRMSSESMYRFMNLDRLTTLSLTNSDTMTIEFHDAVLPVLMACGHNMSALILNRFECVDVVAIGMACPHLENLALSAVKRYCGDREAPASTNGSMFQNLRALELWTNENESRHQINGDSVITTGCDTGLTYITAVFLKMLLNNCKDVQNLLFKGVDVVGHKILAEIWTTNPMSCLSHVTFDHCVNVDRGVMDTILDADNQLNTMRIWSCPLIGKIESDHLIRRAKDENMDVYVEWFN